MLKGGAGIAPRRVLAIFEGVFSAATGGVEAHGAAVRQMALKKRHLLLICPLSILGAL